MKNIAVLSIVLASFALAGPALAASFGANLSYGMRMNADVSAMQGLLAARGLYTGPVTGNFFSQTLAAVKAFQSKESIVPVSGFVGPLTRARLNSLSSGAASSVQSQVSALLEKVAELQAMLNAGGATTTPPATPASSTPTPAAISVSVQIPYGYQVGLGTKNVRLASYRISGSPVEAIVIDSVHIAATATIPGLFTNFRVVVGGTQYGPAVSLSGFASPFNATVTNVGITVPQTGNVTLDVIADANSYQNLSGVWPALSSPTMQVSVPELDAHGAASNQASVSAPGTAISNGTFTVARSSALLTVPQGVRYGGSYQNYLVGAYTFTAGAGTDVSLQSISLGQQLTGTSGGPTSTAFSVFDATQGQAVAVSSPSAITTDGTSNLITFATPLGIPAGTSKTVYLYANLSPFTTKPAGSNSPVTDQTVLFDWRWSDGSTSGIGPDAAYNLPASAIPGSPTPIVIVQ